jgi:hypothetical protein
LQPSSRTFRTPRTRRVLLLLAVVALLAVPTAAVANHMFVDVADGHTHEAGIGYLVDTGITVGCAVNPDRFCPGDSLTRAQMGTFLFRASGNDPATPPSVNAATIAEVEQVSEQTTLNNTNVNTGSVSCPDGMLATGGGSKSTNPQQWRLAESRPTADSTGWVAIWAEKDGNLAASNTVTVWAMCVPVGAP